MPAYPFDPRPLTWTAPLPYRSGSFRGNGKLVPHGMTINPSLWDAKRIVSARIIVGFNVSGEPKWTMDDLVALVKRVREQQVGDPSSTFVAQKGIYQAHDRSLVYEDGAQVFIIDTAGVKKQRWWHRSESTFRKQMMELAETIARDFDQESVILEIQVNGISQGTTGVGP